MADRREHPVLWGLVALVAVSTFLGLILGVGTLAASRLAGLGGDGGDSAGGTGDSLFLPSPSDTSSPTGTSPSGEAGDPSPTPTKPAETTITLTAGQQSVAPMQRIDLTGTYPGGDGAILQVQRLDGRTWIDFPVTTSVAGERFSTYIQTGQTGLNRFRVTDTSSREVSNRVTVTIG